MKKQEKRNLKKEINKQLDEYKYCSNKISKIFDSKIVEQAEKEFNQLYIQLDFLPEEIVKFIKNLKKDFGKTINRIKRENMPKTNNLL